jgi:hypothetical protein
MDDDRLVKMANSIACFFQSEPDHEAAVKGVAGHLERFGNRACGPIWQPRQAPAATVSRRSRWRQQGAS